jgi:carbonic anhydrase
MIDNHGQSPVSAESALQKLLDGNARYVSAGPAYPNQTVERRTEIIKGQHPFAIIVGCSDSRVPPEIIFDQGLGDLFVVRLAGHVLNDEATGSIEYAVEHLGTRLIVVLGHAQCGAVTAVVKGGGAPGHISSIVHAIKPAVDRAKSRPGDLLENAIRENVKMVVDQLQSSSPLLTNQVKDGGLKIVGAYYSLDDGKVTLVP